MERPRVNAYSWPNPSIRDTAHAQYAEGLHYSKISRPIILYISMAGLLPRKHTLSFSDKVWDKQIAIYNTVLNLPYSSIGCGLMDKNAHTRS